MSDRIAVMDRGRIVQLGTPVDIYENPRTRFVATFIGESNLFEEAGRAPIAVRPERMVLSARDRPPGPGCRSAPGIVEDVIYQGEMLRVLVRLEGSGRCTVALRNDGHLSHPLPWTPGVPVLVGWNADDERVLEDG